MQIVEYAKAHPVASGIIAVIGIIVFVMIVGGGSSDSSSGDNGPSDAEIAASAQLQAAQINAQAAVSAAQIGAGVQLNSDNKAAEVAMAQIGVYNNQVNSQLKALEASYANEQAKYKTVVSALPSLKKKNRDDVLKSLVTGEYGYQGAPGPGTIAQIGQAAGGIGQAIGSIASIFSDQRLKENIRLVGYDKRGREVYEWNYKGSNKKRLGYIAQSLAKTDPDKITIDARTGYYKVARISDAR